MLKNVLKTIEKNQLIGNGDSVLISCSGGPDSMCVLDILLKLRDKFGLKLAVAHINHGLRGKEADQDEKFVKKIAEKNNLKFFLKKVNVKKYCKSKKVSSEEGARDLRKKALEEFKHRLNANKIALGHNADDQAETMIMRFIDGSGIKGLRAMSLKEKNGIIRPLLNVSKKEILEYLRKSKIKYRIDKTNKNNVFLRNKIRNKIVPEIKNINPNFLETISGAGKLFALSYDFLEKNAQNFINNYVKEKQGSFIIENDTFENLDKIIQYHVLKTLFALKISPHCHSRLRGNDSMGYKLENEKKVRFKHVENAVEKLSFGKTNFQIKVGANLVFEKNYNEIRIGAPEKEIKTTETRVKIPSNIKWGEYKIAFSKAHNNALKLKQTNCYFINADNIKCEKISVASYRNGDKFKPLGSSYEKKVSDCFIDRKITKKQRKNLPLIKYDGKIVLIPYYTISENFKVRAETKNVLKIEIKN